MRFAARTALTTAALLLGLPAAAQKAQQEPPPEPKQPEILVTGTRSLDEQVSEFVRVLSPARSSGTIPRFLDATCPAVVGLTPKQNEAVATRLRAVATAAQIKVAGPGYAPNALVIVRPDKRAFIEELAKSDLIFWRIVRAPGSTPRPHSRAGRGLAVGRGGGSGWRTDTL